MGWIAHTDGAISSGCDIGVLQEYGPRQIESKKGGRTWGGLLDVQKQLRGNPAHGCMLPTVDASLIMRPDG